MARQLGISNFERFVFVGPLCTPKLYQVGIVQKASTTNYTLPEFQNQHILVSDPEVCAERAIRQI